MYTLAMLAVYRLGIFINTPGVDRSAMNDFMTEQTQAGGLVSLLNMFSGGAIEQMSIFDLGIMPDISASIVMQLLAVVVPTFARLQKEGAAGHQKINQYTRYGSIGLAIVQGIGISRWLASIGRSSDPTVNMGLTTIVVPEYTLWFTFMTVITLTAGTAFIMWLGERITERGVGNGISLIIFAGIIAAAPGAAKSLYDMASADADKVGAVIALAAFMLIVVTAVVFVERGMRRIPVQYAKRMAGRR